MTSLIELPEFTAEAFRDFDGTEVVMTAEMVLFWKPPNPFGQWTPSPFVIEGENYHCAEQFMMAEKARLFGDTEIARQIMGCQDPRKHKKLGRQIENFEESRWAEQRCNIVFRGNVAKFEQNEELKNWLLQTGTRRLVEASPIDRIWGIGLAADHPDAYDPKRWRGLNLLGETLERVREHLFS